MAPLLLDTHSLLLWAFGAPLSEEARREIKTAQAYSDVLLSPVNAWELGMLSARTVGLELGIATDPTAWFNQALNQPGVSLLPLTPEATIRASNLPGGFQRDPADRLLVASAMENGARFVTRDERILDWAQRTGALNTVAC